MVRLRDPTLTSAKFLVSIAEQSSSARSGERQIDVRVGEEPQRETSPAFEPCPQSGASSESRQMAQRRDSQSVTLFMAIICGLLLLIPHESEGWLRIGVTHKLVVSLEMPLKSIDFFSADFIRFGDFNRSFAEKSIKSRNLWQTYKMSSKDLLLVSIFFVIIAKDFFRREESPRVSHVTVLYCHS